MSEAQQHYVDGVLIAWGERWDGSAQIRKGRIAKSGAIVLPVKRQSGSAIAQSVRQNLRGFVRKHPQVVVKISGGGKGMKAIAAHFSYIARHGDVALEDQDGERVEGKEGLAALRDQWAYGHYPIAEESHRREAFNIILSMPAGTDRNAVLRAARDFARDEFGGQHEYVFANHNDELHPHVHLAVKARGRDGTRLNPRKADLRAWRAKFSQKLRDHGIDAVATKRSTRLHRPKGEKQAIRKIKERGQIPRNDVTAKRQNAAALRARHNTNRAMRDFTLVAQVLAGSADVNDRELAVELVQTLPRVQAPSWEEGVEVRLPSLDKSR